MKINDSFSNLYKKIIKEDFSQEYWLKKSKWDEENANLEESEIEINSHNEFEAHLKRGAYTADLTGTIDKTDGTVRWHVSDYNSDFDGPLGIEINGEVEGERKAGLGQTINMVLQNLYAEFKDAFNELNIDDYVGETDEDEEDNIEEESVNLVNEGVYKSCLQKFHEAFENWTPKNGKNLDKEDGINEYDEPYYSWEQEVWVGLNKDCKIYVEANEEGWVQDFDIDEADKAKECIDQCLYDLGYNNPTYDESKKVSISDKKVIKEEATREISEKEFPEDLKKSIKELIKIKEKVDKRWDEDQELNKKVREIGKQIDKFDKVNTKNGIRVPIKYRNLVWDILEKLH